MPADKWDYVTITVEWKEKNPSADALANSLRERVSLKVSELGAQGWELVNTVPVAGQNGRTLLLLMMFKRPKRAA